MALEMSQPAIASLSGVFKIVTAQGETLLLKGQLRRALLAVLLRAPGQARSRAALIDMFWADAAPAKAGASLRSALSELRKDLSALGEGVIVADRMSVTVDRSVLVAAPASAEAEAEFLEGLDLAMSGAGAFEEWLRDQRATVKDRGAPTDLTPYLPADFEADRKETAIGILPCRFATLDSALEASVHHVQDMIFDTLGTVVKLRLFDYRDSFGLTEDETSRLRSGNGPRLMAQTAYLPDRAGLSVKLLDTYSKEVLWAGELHDVIAPHAASVPVPQGDSIAVLVEQIVLALSKAPTYGETLLISPYQALISMFHLENNKMDELQLQLETSALSGGLAVHHALLLYMSTIRSGESIGMVDMSAASNVIEVARMTTQSEDFKAYNLSMSGYALNYLANETDLALDLAETAVSLAPNQAFCWDQLALCNFSAGRLDAADMAARKAQALGLHSPIRYTYDSTAAMVAFAKGDYERAAQAGNRALFRMPKFTPALTYTAAALMQLGRLGDARRLVQQLRQVRPGYSTHSIKTSVHLPQNDNFPARFAESLKRAGLS